MEEEEEDFAVNQATRCIYYKEIYCKDNNSVIYLAIPPESLGCYKTPWTDRKADQGEKKVKKNNIHRKQNPLCSAQD